MASSPDSSPRSKTRRTASSGENLESAASGQGSNEGKRGFYHCNYCNKDISGKIRIKCAQCPDFDLCVECFSVGAEVTPHKSNRPYRVMDNLSFSLICPDWTADEEILLLEGIEMFGLGDWAEIAEHVGTKTKAQCIDHYTTAYLNSPCFPLPDMSYAAGKNREELLAMSKEHAEGKIDVDSGVGSGNTNLMAACSVKKASNMAQVKDGPDSIKVEAYYLNPKYQYSRNLGLDDDLIRAVHTVVEKLELDADIQSRCIDEMKSFRDGNGSFGRLSATRGRDGANPDSQVDRSVGGKKPSMTELSGYNPKRQEFDPEYDNDAEKLLAEMEFKDTDTEAERELKLRVLRIYSKRLDKRKRRKDFILERNLLNPNPLEMELSPEEREIYQRYMVFMRFLSKDKYEELIWTVIEEHRIRKRLQDLEEAKAAGCHTSAEADRFNEQKRKEAEENARRVKESTQAGPNGSPRVGVKGCMGLDSSSEDPPSSTLKQATSCSMDDWDITGYPGSDLLSVTEKRLCQEMKLLPRHYLNMQLKMSVDILNGNITRKSDAYRFFEVEPSKVDRVYDMLVKKGIAQP